MTSASVTSKGQITIPLEVRTRLGLRPGSRLSFVQTGTGVYEIHPAASSIKDLKGVVTGRSQPVSIDEMNEAITQAASSEAP